MKRKPSFLLAIVLAVTLAMSLTMDAWAADGQYKNYGMIKTGVFVPTGDLDDADYDADFNLAVVYGRYFGNYLVLEGAVDFYASDKDFDGYTSSTGYYEVDNLIGISALSVSIKGVIPLGEASFYCGAGIGIYFADLSTEVETSTFGDFDGDDEYDSVFGCHIVAGGNYNITQRIFIGLEGIYRWTGEVDIDDRVATIPVGFEGDLDGYTISISAGFRF